MNATVHLHQEPLSNGAIDMKHWDTPSLVCYGSVREMTASGTGLFIEQVLCDDTIPPTNCVPVPNPDRALRP